MLKRTCAVTVLAALPLHMTSAAETFTANTLRAGAGDAPSQVSIATMSWLAGSWEGSGLGAENEEVWSAPRQGVMMGAYRHMKDGRPVLYELLTLSESKGSLELRLRHFDAALRGWEAQNDSLAFPFITERDGRIHFEGLTFEPRGDALTVYLAIQDKQTGATREEVFRYRRVKQR